MAMIALDPTPAQLRTFGAYLRALAEGEGGRQAAADCGISYQTFKNRIVQVHQRLGVTNSIQAAMQLGMIRWNVGSAPGGVGQTSLVSHDDPVAGVPSDTGSRA